MVVYSLDNLEAPFAKMPLEQVHVFEVMYSGPDTVITVGNDIRIWNYQKISLFQGKCMVNLGLRAVINLNFHESVRNSLCVADAQKWILIPTERGFVAYDCDGHVQRNVSAAPAAPGDPAAVSRGGVLATSHGKGGIAAWTLSGEKIARCEAGGVKRLAWMDEAVVVHVDQSECLCVWDIESGMLTSITRVYNIFYNKSLHRNTLHHTNDRYRWFYNTAIGQKARILPPIGPDFRPGSVDLLSLARHYTVEFSKLVVRW